MDKHFSMNRIIAFLLIVAALLALASCGKKDDVRSLEYELKLAELNAKKYECEDEIYLLESGMRAAIGHNSYMSFIFLGVDSGIYDDILPIMESDDMAFTGVLCFFEDELPGMEGNITLEQYADLVDRGWETAWYWRGAADGDDGSADLEVFLSAMETEFSERLGDIDSEFPTSIVFDAGVYLPEYDIILERHGVKNAVCDGEDDVELVTDVVPEGIWHTVAIGWRNLQKSIKLRNAILSDGGYASFKISFDRGEDDFDTSFYAIEGEMVDIGDNMNSTRVAKFKSMLAKFNRSVKDGDMCIAGISKTRSDMEIYYPQRDSYIANKDARIAELQAIIDDVEKRKAELYREYF